MPRSFSLEVRTRMCGALARDSHKYRKRPLTPMRRESRAVRGGLGIRRCGDVPPAPTSIPFRPPRGRGSGDTTAALLRAAPSLARARNAAWGVSWVGLASRCHDVTGHGWSGNRTRDNQQSKLMLYPLSYPVVDVPESNRRPRPCGRCSDRLSYRHRETPSPTLRHTQRQCRAYRTGLLCESGNPYRCSVFDRCSILPAVANRQCLQAHCAQSLAIHSTPRASKHHNAAHMRPLPLRPRFGVQSSTPDASGQKHGSVRLDWLNSFDAYASLANARNKTPPGLATRGRSRCLGRSGWPISQGVQP